LQSSWCEPLFDGGNKRRDGQNDVAREKTLRQVAGCTIPAAMSSAACWPPVYQIDALRSIHLIAALKAIAIASTKPAAKPLRRDEVGACLTNPVVCDVASKSAAPVLP
jgi:hypothetical protein